MTHFDFLPPDLQRLVCALLEYKDIKKVLPKFYNNENDVYWKEKVSTVTDESTPKDTTHRAFYESFIYEKVISGWRTGWDRESLLKMVGDEIFLTRHINAKSHFGTTALMFAAREGMFDYVKILLEYDANVDEKNNNDETALMIAMNSTRSADIIKMLLQFNPDVNIKNKWGNTALITSIIDGRKIEIIQLLLDAKADIDTQNDDNETALMYAAYDSQTKTVELLLNAGANTNLQDKNGKKAIDHSANAEIRNLLKSRFS
jgi:ankyrin repeat protein